MVQHAVSDGDVAPQNQGPAAPPCTSKALVLGVDPAENDADRLHQSAGIRPLRWATSLTEVTAAETNVTREAESVESLNSE